MTIVVFYPLGPSLQVRDTMSHIYDLNPIRTLVDNAQSVRFISQDIKLIATQHGFYSLNNFSHEFSQRRGGKKKKTHDQKRGKEKKYKRKE